MHEPNDESAFRVVAEAITDQWAHRDTDDEQRERHQVVNFAQVNQWITGQFKEPRDYAPGVELAEAILRVCMFLLGVIDQMSPEAARAALDSITLAALGEQMGGAEDG